MMHSQNMAAAHARKCGGKLSLEVNDKAFGRFELYRCQKCSYVGRGAAVELPGKETAPNYTRHEATTDQADPQGPGPGGSVKRRRPE